MIISIIISVQSCSSILFFKPKLLENSSYNQIGVQPIFGFLPGYNSFQFHYSTFHANPTIHDMVSPLALCFYANKHHDQPRGPKEATEVLKVADCVTESKRSKSCHTFFFGGTWRMENRIHHQKSSGANHASGINVGSCGSDGYMSTSPANLPFLCISLVLFRNL